MDPTVHMAIRLTFKAYWQYGKMEELVRKLGIERELRKDRLETKYVGTMHPRIEFTLWNQEKRAIFLRSEPSDENQYSLVIPDNRLLYSKIYSLLKGHNLSLKARMVELTDTGIPESLYGLLMRY